MILSQELGGDNPVTFVPSPRLAVVLKDPCVAWVSLPGPATYGLVASVPVWDGPGQLTTLPYWGAEIALTLENQLHACGGWVLKPQGRGAEDPWETGRRPRVPAVLTSPRVPAPLFSECPKQKWVLCWGCLLSPCGFIARGPCQ